MLPTWQWLLIFFFLEVAAFLVARYSFGFSASTSPVNPVIAFGTSPCFSPTTLHCVRIIAAFLMVILLAYDLWKNWQFGYWWIYLTHWALFVETVYMVMLSVVSKDMVGKFEQNSKTFEETRTVQVYMVFQSIILPLSLLITIVYWTALCPVWEICEFNGNKPGCTPFPRDESVFVHFFNTILIFSLFCCSNIPFQAKNGGWVMIFCSVYAVWTILHFFLKIGNEVGCPDYPTNECTIYNIIDWHKPEKTLVIVAGLTFVLTPLVDLTCIGIYKCRRKTHNRDIRETESRKPQNGGDLQLEPVVTVV